MINYRANIWALKELGVKWIISVSAVGSLRMDYKPGDFVVPDQFIDMTKKREYTFFDGPTVAHVSMADPFCNSLRKRLVEKSKSIGITVHEREHIYALKVQGFLPGRRVGHGRSHLKQTS